MELNDAIGNQLGLGYGSYGLGSIHMHEEDLKNARSCFKRAQEIFEKLSVFQMVTACRLMLADIHLQLDEYAEAREIMDGLDREALSPGNLSDMKYLVGRLDMMEFPSDEDVLKVAVKTFRDVIASTDTHSSVDLSRYYTALVGGLTLLDAGDASLKALAEGAEKLAERLGKVSKYSVRNSLMTRREIKDFLALCEKMELPFPPEGYDLKVVDSAKRQEDR